MPAYAHTNPLIDFLFWKRLGVALEMVQFGTAKNVLDFGCGTGVMSYALSKAGFSVTATDVEFSPLETVKQRIDFPSDIKFVEGNVLEDESLQNEFQGKFDAVLALDVLEHIEDLDRYVPVFKNLLAPGGKLIVSGPSENLLYSLGRKIAGKRFTGDYHVTNIKAIKKIFNKEMKIGRSKKLVFPFVLFEVFELYP